MFKSITLLALKTNSRKQSQLTFSSNYCCSFRRMKALGGCPNSKYNRLVIALQVPGLKPTRQPLNPTGGGINPGATSISNWASEGVTLIMKPRSLLQLSIIIRKFTNSKNCRSCRIQIPCPTKLSLARFSVLIDSASLHHLIFHVSESPRLYNYTSVATQNYIIVDLGPVFLPGVSCPGPRNDPAWRL